MSHFLKKNSKGEIFEPFSFKFCWIITNVQNLTLSSLDQNSNMAFLRNEFSKIFEDLLTMTHIYDQIKKLADKCPLVRNAN